MNRCRIRVGVGSGARKYLDGGVCSVREGICRFTPRASISLLHPIQQASLRATVRVQNGALANPHLSEEVLNVRPRRHCKALSLSAAREPVYSLANQI